MTAEIRLSRAKVMSLADIEEHWVKAATYDVVCARRADQLLRMDNIVMNVVLVLTTVTSVGAFAAIAANPAAWAKVTVGIITASAAVLTAVRQQNSWARESGALRERGIGWNRQRTFAGDLAQRIIDGGTAEDSERLSLNEGETRLLQSHPRIPTRMYNEVKKAKLAEFNTCYKFLSPAS
jgi:hypothetical protein